MRKKLALLLIPLAIFAGACTSQDAEDKARRHEESQTGLNQLDLQKAHPIPKYNRSQVRQNMIELMTATAETTQTTTFFFNQGAPDPIMSCPSIGFPIPSTAQLTNPEAKVNRHDLTLPQAEPTGIYTGDSEGTYIICVDAQGKAYAAYWEGNVQAVSGPASWDAAAKQVKLTGPSSFDFSEGNSGKGK